MPSVKKATVLGGGKIRYMGYEFQGWNKPRRSWVKGKQKAVLARKGDQFKLIHYGDPSMPDNKSKAQRDSFIARATGIRDGSGNLTKDDKFSANYWALRDLWDYKG